MMKSTIYPHKLYKRFPAALKLQIIPTLSTRKESVEHRMKIYLVAVLKTIKVTNTIS